MRQPHKPIIDSCSIANATGRAKYYADELIKRAELVRADLKQAERYEKCQCVMCFTSPRIGGSMMTQSACGICSVVMNFANTCTDTLCFTCAKGNLLCKRCGGDIDMKQRRKKRPFQEQPKPTEGNS